MAKEASADTFDVIVVGAGMGGLTVASLLAKAGKKVLAVEKEPRPGGFVSPLVCGDYEFDTAARLLMGCTADGPLGPGPIYSLLDQLGVRDQCEFIRVQPFITIHSPGQSFQMWSGREAFVENLGQVSRAGLANLPAQLQLWSQVYRGVVSASTASWPWGVLKAVAHYPDLARYRNSTVEDVLARSIPDERSRSAVSSLLPYIGLGPERASFVMWAAVMASYIDDGAFFCRGGLHRVADAVADALIRLGGELLLGCEVRKVLVSDRRVLGVTLASGQEVFAPVVISGMDCRSLFRDLIDPTQTPSAYRARLDRSEPSLQAVGISFVTDLDFPALGFGFESLVYDSQLGYSMTVTTAADPSLAPPRQHLVSALRGFPADSAHTPESTDALASELLLGIETRVPDLRNHLLLSRDGSVPKGYVTQEFPPMYGWAATPQQIGPGRLGRRTPVRGLYLVGHWTQPGHGVLTVVLSGMALAKEIMSERRSSQAVSLPEAVTR